AQATVGVEPQRVAEALETPLIVEFTALLLALDTRPVIELRIDHLLHQLFGRIRGCVVHRSNSIIPEVVAAHDAGDEALLALHAAIELRRRLAGARAQRARQRERRPPPRGREHVGYEQRSAFRTERPWLRSA